MKLEEKINYLSEKWELTRFRACSQSIFTGNYVTIAYSKEYDTEVVLKISTPEDLVSEQMALNHFHGDGCVKMLNCDKEKGGLLIEHIKPGLTLKDVFANHDTRTVEIFNDIVTKLHFDRERTCKNPSDFQTTNEWLNSLKNHDDKNVPNHLMQKAKKLCDKLLAKQGKLYCLHGDLHHQNILKHGSSWIAVDPKGIIGELEYEFSTFIRNPIPELLENKNASETILYKIEQFSQNFNLDKQRLLDWSFIQSVLSACYSRYGNEYFIKAAELLYPYGA